MARSVPLVVGLSFALHGGIALAVVALPKERKREATAIAIHESKPKKDDKKKPDPPKRDEPPPPPKERATQAPQRAKSQAPAKPDAAPPPAAKPAAGGGDGLPDLGFALGGPGGGGLAVPTGGGGGGGGDAAPKQAAKAPEPQSRPKIEECADPLVKAKPKRQVQPPYPDAARESGTQGVAKVEVQIDENGRVRSARVVAGLGHGFDEAALAAAKQWTFEPASRCGKPEGSSRTLSFRFQIGT